jgi:hypothetical protein
MVITYPIINKLFFLTNPNIPAILDNIISNEPNRNIPTNVFLKSGSIYAAIEDIIYEYTNTYSNDIPKNNVDIIPIDISVFKQ